MTLIGDAAGWINEKFGIGQLHELTHQHNTSRQMPGHSDGADETIDQLLMMTIKDNLCPLNRRVQDNKGPESAGPLFITDGYLKS